MVREAKKEAGEKKYGCGTAIDQQRRGMYVSKIRRGKACCNQKAKEI
jgi:hypothetical protein